jgi:hypothetical protein
MCAVTTAHSKDRAEDLVECAVQHNITKDCGDCIKQAYEELPEICKNCVSSATACFRTCETDLKCIKSCEDDAMSKCRECREAIVPKRRSHIMNVVEADGSCTTGKDADQVNNQEQCKAAVSYTLSNACACSSTDVISSKSAVKTVLVSPVALKAAWRTRTACRPRAQTALELLRNAV